MRLGFTICVFLMVSSITAQHKNDEFQVGRIINQVAVNNSSETYALYLPSTYDSSSLSAVVFIFDPLGRGDQGLKPFIEASEEFNYILACSNNAKNNTEHNVNLNIAGRFINDVLQKFKIDEDQIITAGFSGGARLASSITALSKEVKASIACGAGMEIHEGYKLHSSQFKFVGIVGDADMNYREMLQTESKLKALGASADIIIFNGGHSWPSSNEIKKAFYIIEASSYSKKVKLVDSVKVNKFYVKQMHLADSLHKANKLLRAIREYRYIQNHITPFYTKLNVKEKIASIEKSDAFKDETIHHEKVLQEEAKLYTTYYDRFQLELRLGKSIDDYKWWNDNLKILKPTAKIILDDVTSKMYQRLSYAVFALAVETSNVYSVNKDFQRSLYCDKLLTIINPKQGYWFFRLAKSYANLGNETEVVENLKLAMSLGFNDKSQILNSMELKPYLSSKRIKRLVSEL